MQVIENKNVLDIGCAEGSFTKKCSEFAARTVGMDAVESYIQSAKQYANDRLTFFVANSKAGMQLIWIRLMWHLFEKDLHPAIIICQAC